MTSTGAMLYQLKQLKGKPLKQQLEHIVTYFWLPILLTAAILIATVSYVVHLVTLKEEALNVMCVNAVSNIEADEEVENTYRIREASPALFEILPSISWTFKF
jgi:hypothetical protein